MSTIYLLKYNNYYNRKVLKLDTLGDYLTTDRLLATFENINFVPADGVNTTLTINYEGVTNPDYLIVANGNDIMSRWFVIESDVIRGGQYSLTLHRDLLVDSYDMIIKAPCFIEKATLPNSDPMIFNKEDMTFNQIKTSESPLKDETGCAWVVGYIPKDSFTGDEASRTVNGDVILGDSGQTADIIVENLSDWSYNIYSTGGKFKGSLINPLYAVYAYKAGGMIGSGKYSSGSVASYNGWHVNTVNTPTATNTGFTINTSFEDNGIKEYQTSGIQNTSGFNGQLRTIAGCAYPSDENTFKNLNGKVIYETSSGLYRRVRIVSTYQENIQQIISPTSTPQLALMFNSALKKTGTYYSIQGSPNDNSFRASYSYYEYTITYEQLTVSTKVVISTPENRYHLEDQPYDMFCIPYSDDLQIYKNGTALVKANKSIAINMATQIGAATGSANVYDVQLLPYCPVRYCLLEDNTFDIKEAKVDLVKDPSNNTVGVVLWAITSAFTLDIPYTIEVTNPKESNQLDLYRLTSPNFNGQFEFSPAMNGGVDSFNIDCNYKPYNPYIHINPNFKNLYGQDFNDARGLICGGDFSLPQLSNAWANYQLNNKNYQSMFDREIQNLQVTQKYERISDIASAITGTVSGGVGGAMVGGKVGAAVGSLLSLGGGIADAYINEQLRAEALDYKKDMYNYQLGNIQALPTSLTKTSAFTYNNKIFPILEYYTCTEQEKQAFRNKLKYNGMSVGRIGTISEFLGNATDQYIKGRVIRLEGVSDDFHYFKAISDEIYKGAFF